MKSNFNVNIVLGILCVSTAIAFNPYTLFILLNFSDVPLLFNNIFILTIADIILAFSGILFIINRKKEKFLSLYVKLFAFNTFLLILLFLIIEIVFGNWFKPNNLNQLNIIRSREIHYNIENLYSSDNNMITYTRDEWGLRGNYPSVDSIDILTIGGSTTDQRYIPDGFTFQDILQNELQSQGKNVYVVNAGIDGQSTFGNIKNFDWWFPHIPDLSVDYYLFYIGDNDFFTLDSNRFDDLLQENDPSIGDNFKLFIKVHSALFYLNRTINGIILANFHGLAHDVGGGIHTFSTDSWVNYPLVTSYESIMENHLDAYEDRLNILCNRVSSAGSIPIFVSQSIRRNYNFIDGQLYGVPSMGEYNGQAINGVDYYYMSRLLNERTRRVCLANSGIYIDLDEELEFDLEVDFYDHCHHTPSGAEKIGKYLFSQLNYLF